MELFFSLASEHMPALLRGLRVTVMLAVVSMIVGSIIGVLLALGRIYFKGIIRWLCVVYIEIIRGTPMLAQLFILYYALPPYGIRLDAMQVAFLGFTLNVAAYQAEYTRGPIESISGDQMTAAYAIGMTKWQAVFQIILPQALRRAIPAWTNEFIYILKYTSLAYIIGTPELLTEAKIIASRNYQFFTMYLIVACLYLIVVLIFGYFFDWIEKRMRIPGIGYYRARPGG